MGCVRTWIIDEAARWWSQAPNEARFRLLERVTKEAPQEITIDELRLAIIAAETEAGEVCEAGPAREG
jgi:hypothetical protein